MTAVTDLKALDELRASRGWAIMRSRMEAEILQAARNLGNQIVVPQQAVDFQRGAIWAAGQLIEMPNRIIQEIQTDLTLAKGKELS